MKTAREILKNAMSVNYCGETRFDFLDSDERPLIYKAMKEYAKQEAVEFAKWISEQGWWPRNDGGYCQLSGNGVDITEVESYEELYKIWKKEA